MSYPHHQEGAPYTAYTHAVIFKEMGDSYPYHAPPKLSRVEEQHLITDGLNVAAQVSGTYPYHTPQSLLITTDKTFSLW